MSATLLLTAALAIASPPQTETPEAEVTQAAHAVYGRERSVRIEPTVGVGAMPQFGLFAAYLGGVSPVSTLGGSLVLEEWRGHRGLALRGQVDVSNALFGERLVRGQVGLVSLSRSLGRGQRGVVGVGALAGVQRRTWQGFGLLPSSELMVTRWMPVATVHGEIGADFDFDNGATRLRPAVTLQAATSGAVMVGTSLGFGAVHRPAPSPAW